MEAAFIKQQHPRSSPESLLGAGTGERLRVWNSLVRVRVGTGSPRCSAVPEAVWEDEGRMWMILFVLKQREMPLTSPEKDNPGALGFS